MKRKIVITEEYCVGEVYGVKSIITTDNYGPSTPGAEYIWFLCLDDREGSPWEGTYYPVVGIKGRYRIPDKNETIRTYDNKNKNGIIIIDGYGPLYAEVSEKYVQ